MILGYLCLMFDIRFKPEHEQIRRTIRDFAEREITPTIQREIDVEDRFPIELFRKMGKQGLLGMFIPPEYGGSGLDMMGSVIAMEEVAKASASAALFMDVQNGLVCFSINKYGDEDQKEKYLRGLAKGEMIGAFGLTEPKGGTDVAAIETKAVREGDEYRINGTKTFISQGAVADVVLLFARTGRPEEGHRGVSAFIVERGSPGFRVGAKLDVLGVRGTGTSELVFEDCRIPSTNLLGGEGEGFYIAMDTLNVARIIWAAAAVGVAQAAFEVSLRYASEREAFGRPIGGFQGIQWMLSKMATEIDAARLLTYRAACLFDQGGNSVKEASMAKLYASEVAVEVTKKAIQIHGAYGYSKDHPLERYYRDAKVFEIGEGTSEIQRTIIARELLKDVEPAPR